MSATMNSEEPVLSAKYVIDTLKYLQGLGLDLSDEIKAAGLNESFLRDELNHSDLINLSQFILLFQNEKIKKIPSLGLGFGSHLNILYHGFLGLAVSTQPSLSASLKLSAELINNQLSILKTSFVEYDEAFGIRLEKAVPLGDSFRLLCEMTFSSFVSVGRTFSPEDLALYGVTFSYNQPDYHEEYNKFFDTKIEFNAPYSELLVPKRRFHEPMFMADESTTKYALNKMNILQENDHKGFLPKKIKDIIEEDASFPSLSDMADTLAMSPRTLRRKLQQFQCSYQEIVNDVKKEMAMRYLRDNEKSLTEIATLLEFQDSAHFCKSFSKWTHQNPSDFRKHWLNSEFRNLGEVKILS